MSKLVLIEEHVTRKFGGTILRHPSVSKLFDMAQDAIEDGFTVLILCDEPVVYSVPQEVDGVELLMSYVEAMQLITDPDIHITKGTMEGGKPVLLVKNRAILMGLSEATISSITQTKH